MPEDQEAVDIYTEEGRELETEGDEINELEEGFMKGYEQKHMAECANCGKVLKDYEGVVELDIEGEIFRFCCEQCAEDFQSKKDSEEE